MALEAEAEAQTRIEQLLDGNLSTWPPSTGSITSTHYAGTLHSPECLQDMTGGGASSADVKYASLVSAMSSGATAWELVADVTETDTGARAVVHQGIIWTDSTGVSCPPVTGP